MRKILLVTALLIGSLSTQAQEKVMNILKADGTSAQTRVADLKQISFLAMEDGDQGLIVKTLGGETVGVRFQTNPVVTVVSGKLNIKSSDPDPVQIEITEIAEITFGEVAADALNDLKGFEFLLQEGGALLRGIPAGTQPRVYSLDGRQLPTPAIHGGELLLNRASLGKGIFVVKVGTFVTKIQL